MSPVLALILSLMLTQEVAPAAAPVVDPAIALPITESEEDYPIPSGAPSDDYGLVAWCYGALAGHMGMYDKVIGDVERIEVEIAKLPGAPPADMKAYKEQREAGRDTLKMFRRAMTGAEKASPTPIANQGAAALKAGGSVWSGMRTTDKQYVAREWMSWGLPGRCLPTAERLEAQSSLFGQAVSYNAKPKAATPAPAPAADPIVGTPMDPMSSEPAPAEPTTTAPDVIAPPATTEEAPPLRGPQHR